jgi:phosphomannomutase
MGTLSDIVKAYDIRGVVGDELTAELAESLGRAAATELDASAMVVGRDMRPSSESLAAAFMTGLHSQGVDAVDIGLAATDMLYYASGTLGLPGAMWTASHNPPEYNGLKLCRAGAEPISLDTGLAAIRDRVQSGDYPQPQRQGQARKQALVDDYATHVRGFIDPAAVAGLSVAVDAGNGMAGLVVPAVFEGLQAKLSSLYFDLDGTFPNHPPNPIDPANLLDLQQRVRDQGCDLGLAFDGDADRMFCVDERGELVESSLVTAVIADTLLARHPGATVLYNLICSRTVPEVIEAAGGTAVRTRVGHSYVKAVMAETEAIFGGEHSGHYYFRDNFRADSGLIAAVVLLEALGVADRPLSELLAPYDRYARSGERNVEVDDQSAATEAAAAAFATEGELDWTDGLTVDGGAWWFNLRPSNTEPVLRLNVEAGDSGTVEQLVSRVLSELGR